MYLPTVRRWGAQAHRRRTVLTAKSCDALIRHRCSECPCCYFVLCRRVSSAGGRQPRKARWYLTTRCHVQSRPDAGAAVPPEASPGLFIELHKDGSQQVCRQRHCRGHCQCAAANQYDVIYRGGGRWPECACVGVSRQ